CGDGLGLGTQGIAGVVVTRVPQHPADTATLGGATDLGLDLADAEDTPVVRVVPEVLEPGPHLYHGLLGALAGEPYALAHDLVGGRHRIAIAGYAQVIARRVHHGTNVIEVRRQLFDPLPDVRVVGVEGGVAEEVGRDVDACRPQLTPGLREEGRDRR